MTTRCKNGDIAIVLRDSPGCEGNVGRLVEVRGPTSTNCYPGLVSWYIRQIGDHGLWFIAEADGRITQEKLTWSSRVFHPDAWLLPIRPAPDQKTEANEIGLPQGYRPVQSAPVPPAPAKATPPQSPSVAPKKRRKPVKAQQSWEGAGP